MLKFSLNYPIAQLISFPLPPDPRQALSCTGSFTFANAVINDLCPFINRCKGKFYYRPQTKFAKVMYLHVSVCLKGEYLGRNPLGRYPRLGRYPPGQVLPLGRYNRTSQVHPLDRYTPSRQVHPSLVVLHAGRYGQQASGTHPTGMLSCFGIF